MEMTKENYPQDKETQPQQSNDMGSNCQELIEILNF